MIQKRRNDLQAQQSVIKCHKADFEVTAYRKTRVRRTPGSSVARATDPFRCGLCVPMIVPLRVQSESPGAMDPLPVLVCHPANDPFSGPVKRWYKSSSERSTYFRARYPEGPISPIQLALVFPLQAPYPPPIPHHVARCSKHAFAPGGGCCHG